MKLIVQEFVWKVSLNKFDDMLYLCIIKMHITRHRHRTLSVLLRGFVCMRSSLSARSGIKICMPILPVVT